MSSYQFRRSEGADHTAPMFFVFHGTGGDEDQFFELAGQLLPGAAIIAPRGDVSEGGALRYFRRTGEGVYDMEDLKARTETMADFVKAQLAERAPSSVIGLGYSNGANILASVQFSHPKLFDATMLMHPLIPFAPPSQPDLAGKSVLITAGRRDPIAPAEATEGLAGYFREQQAQVDLFWHEGGHEIRQEELLRVQQALQPFSIQKA
ncbi:phospholipase/carboxylesterase [Devosia pacifica]|uniref:Phospholipase/carboxylesterase n=1 Tax=Devosia pacifica TaxID=1335967 RepID=A0A918S9M9_9HYPH|nr:alpha/beta hydrolase [Devosia pacifica]GHA27939.1 phospholipase/carboxylesterase [Devosia pacifica]